MSLFGHIVVTVFFIIFHISMASAAQPFDINGDGQEGLPEAIHALQVSSCGPWAGGARGPRPGVQPASEVHGRVAWLRLERDDGQLRALRFVRKGMKRLAPAAGQHVEL